MWPNLTRSFAGTLLLTYLSAQTFLVVDYGKVMNDKRHIYVQRIAKGSCMYHLSTEGKSYMLKLCSERHFFVLTAYCYLKLAGHSSLEKATLTNKMGYRR
jgi:hypothetical protein